MNLSEACAAKLSATWDVELTPQEIVQTVYHIAKDNILWSFVEMDLHDPDLTGVVFDAIDENGQLVIEVTEPIKKIIKEETKITI